MPDERGPDERKKDAPARKRQPRPRKAGAAVRHLRPELKDIPEDFDITTGTSLESGVASLDEALEGVGDEDFAKWEAELAKLREPFPPDRIEKLPKPLWKGAWDTGRKGQCHICGGYHVIENTIHLDYVGHANCTDRLLSVDPTWNWEPLAYTPEGLPLFSNGGLWIKLTVCGVTRIGFGDGNSVKEIIGDAIRNAAMRFGVALDLWAKINLHEERNPGDGPTQQRDGRGNPGGRRGSRQDGPGRSSEVAAAAPSRPNQAALDALASVCKKHGYSEQYCIDRYYSDHDAHIADASEEDIFAFADTLITEATVEDAGSGVGQVVPADAAPVDEAQAEELF